MGTEPVFLFISPHRLRRDRSGESSLQNWAALLKALFGVSISKQAIDERLIPYSAAFAQKLVNHLITTHTKMNQQFLKAMTCFKHILLQSRLRRDTFALLEGIKDVFKGNVSNGVQKAILRLKAIIDFTRLTCLVSSRLRRDEARQVTSLGITPYRDNDHLAASNIHHLVRKDTLVIRDLGYWGIDSLIQITNSLALGETKPSAQQSKYL